MFASLYNTIFGPSVPRCPGTGSKLLAARRAATDSKYTARPLDFFPNPLISPEELSKARAEGDVLDEMFQRYKREASCEKSPGKGRRGRKCEGCGEWCCNACRFHTSYRIVCSSPLLFSDEVHVPPGCSDHAMIAPNKRMQTLQIRLRDHEQPYALALTQQYAQRWNGYCHDCLPRVSTSLIQQIDGRFEACKCERSDAEKRYRRRWICTCCFEKECADIVGKGFEDKECQGRGCGAKVSDVGWDRFQPVCSWCLRILGAKELEVARAAVRDGEGFETLRRDPRR